MSSQTNGHDSDSGEQQSSQLTSPIALRKLVLNYLIHHCYTDTAQAFAHDGISSSSSQLGPEINGTGVSNSGRRNAGGEVMNGGSSSASGSAAPQTRSHSRMTNQQSLGGAHPLSAPPLSREDSSMEIEVDSLLSLAGGRATVGNGSGEGVTSGVSNGHENGASQRTDLEGQEEDTQMEERGQMRETANHDETLSEEELSTAELQSVRVRSDIKDHILNGRIKLAVDLCNANFPTVLNADPSISTAYEKEAEQSRGSKQVSSQVKEKESTSGTTARVLPANPTSLYPAHLSLNLQIQAFIESVRAASTSSSNTNQSLSAAVNAIGPMAGSQYLAASTPGINPATNALSRSASPAPSSASSNGSGTSANGLSGSAHSNGSAAVLNPVLHAALSHAQLLFTNVQKLPGYWRAMYLKELESVTALLAYTDLERSPVRKYLDQSRRVALAEQINSAIMFRTGKPSQPLIESAVRQTSYLWSTLSSEKVVVPTDHAIFTSGTVLGIDKFESQPVGGSGNDRIKTKGKVLPPWSLHSFLMER